MRWLPYIGLLLCLTPAFSLAFDQSGWLGIYSESVAALPAIETEAGGDRMLTGATCGLRVIAVFPDSPAEQGGLILGDIIISVFNRPFTCSPDSVSHIFRNSMAGSPPGTPCPIRVIRDEITRSFSLNDSTAEDQLARQFWRTPGNVITELESGEAIKASVSKRQEVLDLPVVLGLRPEAHWAAAKSNEKIYNAGRYPISGFAPLVWELADEYDIRPETEDLIDRLARCHDGSDPFRLDCMIYAHRDPFRLESVSMSITNEFKSARSASDLIAATAELWVPGYELKTPDNQRLLGPEIPGDGQTPEERLAPLIGQINQIFGEARQWYNRAFADLTPAEMEFLEAERWNISDVFAEATYLHFDEDKDRFSKNKRLIDLATRINYGALLEAAARLALLTDPEWVMHAGRLLHAVYADDLGAEILYEYASPFGRYLFGGTTRHWYRQTDAAFILDLGGNDFYTGNCGGGNSLSTPLSICIDLDGDDAYESTEPGSQGAGTLGIGALLDLSGNDTYISNQWGQGVGYFGIGWLQDLAGDDTYRGRTFCQAVGLFGTGYLLDESGNDRYEGDGHVQAVGLAKGVGALIDASGNDEYYAKGLYPTGYGDAGIFDAWSQGCGQGFRTLASGGLGLLIDNSGRDRMEAGNFSQGGGYYYGYGIVFAGGRGNDTYIGSRYNQGFAAHQALGVFLEEGGNDFYTTRQGVAQGLAWDECVTLFIDLKGNDTYQGGSFFSQGASAHNSFSFFLDRGGRDSYEYIAGQARAGGNNYHGGTSFSLFIDEGGKRDLYTAPDNENRLLRHEPEHGFFMDIPGTYTKMIDPRTWWKYVKEGGDYER